MQDVKWYVVTEKNLEDFKDRFRDDNGTFVAVATTIDGYQRLSLNMADLERYVEQQKQLIVYYENSIKYEANWVSDMNAQEEAAWHDMMRSRLAYEGGQAYNGQLD